MRGHRLLWAMALALLASGCPALFSDDFRIAPEPGPSSDGASDVNALDPYDDASRTVSPDVAAREASNAVDATTDASGGSIADAPVDRADAPSKAQDSGSPSCSGLPPTCGPTRGASCCGSSVVPGGTYNRSNDPTDPATVSDFRLDAYEITVGRFRRFVGAYSQSMTAAGSGKNPSNATDPGWSTAWNASLPADVPALTAAVKCHPLYQTWTDGAGADENLPINCIDWYQAFAFCIWDGGRLPTEAEWNYAAAGGGEQRAYPWGAAVPGADTNLAIYGCFYDASGQCSGAINIAPVGSVSAGNGKWGQADLAGNLWEWNLDWYANPYPQALCLNCANTTTASLRVFRGGSFSNSASYQLSSTRGDAVVPTNLNVSVGARCARAP